MHLELSAWGDGTIRLSLWDSLYGNDRHFLLGDDGKAYEASAAESDEEIFTPVDLLGLLRIMAQEEQNNVP